MITHKTILFLPFIPGLCLGVLPVWLIQTGPALFSFGLVRWLALLLLWVGWSAILWCCWNFIVKGRGAPNPLDPLRELVVAGHYHFVRYYEEPHLRKIFGATRENYCRSIPRSILHRERSPI